MKTEGLNKVENGKLVGVLNLVLNGLKSVSGQGKALVASREGGHATCSDSSAGGGAQAETVS